jgi:hypothetical protein
LQQVGNNGDDCDHKRKNVVLHSTGNKSKDSFEEEEDDLIDAFG